MISLGVQITDVPIRRTNLSIYTSESLIFKFSLNWVIYHHFKTVAEINEDAYIAISEAYFPSQPACTSSNSTMETLEQ